jgi:type II secretion system protein G
MVLIESTRKETRKGGDRVNKWLKALLRRTNGEKGVTLIELLAVIVIIAVIAAIAVPVVLGSIHKSKTNTTKQSMTVIAEALNRYAADHDGKFPTSTNQSAFEALTSTSTVGKKLLGTDDQDKEALLQNIPTDAWGQNFYYWSDGNNFELETAVAANASGATGDALYLSNRMTAPANQPPANGVGNW